MRLEFTHTFDDYREGVAEVMEWQRKANMHKRRSWLPAIILAAIIVAMFWLLPMIDRGFSPILPLMLGALAMLIMVWLSMTTPWYRRWPVLLFILGILGAIALNLHASSSSRLSLPLGPHLLWFIMLLLLAFAAARMTRRQVHTLWEGQHNLRRPHTLEVNDQGVIVTEPLTRHDYAWESFPRYLESRSLFLLCPSDVTFVMVPKRAFASEADMAAFKALLEQRISSRTRAFPVLPLSARPLPPPPLEPMEGRIS